MVRLLNLTLKDYGVRRLLAFSIAVGSRLVLYSRMARTE
jgi:hypothetical protein